MQGKMFPASTVLALLIMGFVLGGVFVGSLANGSVLAIGSSAKTSPNVVIVSGASNSAILQSYSPTVFTVKVGTTVTWVNNDTVTHTVTSTSVPSGAQSFTSGFLAYGNTFSYTFIVLGTYNYDCTIHPFMKGTIVVTS
jgi:amicyanin